MCSSILLNQRAWVRIRVPPKTFYATKTDQLKLRFYAIGNFNWLNYKNRFVLIHFLAPMKISFLMMGGSDNFWLTDIVDVVAIFTLQR